MTEYTQYTPGPWTWHNTPKDGIFIRAQYRATDGRMTTNYPATINMNPLLPSEANAHLVAAAPEMLDALIEIVASAIDANGHYARDDGGVFISSQAFHQARDAVAKAEGKKNV